MKYYKCIVCKTPITKLCYLNANGCCSQYCVAIYSGYPMPHEHNSLKVFIEKIPKKF